MDHHFFLYQKETGDFQTPPGLWRTWPPRIPVVCYPASRVCWKDDGPAPGVDPGWNGRGCFKSHWWPHFRGETYTPHIFTVGYIYIYILSQRWDDPSTCNDWNPTLRDSKVGDQQMRCSQMVVAYGVVTALIHSQLPFKGFTTHIHTYAALYIEHV